MSKVPECIGIIMDGNRRWAKAKGLPRVEGHNAGYRKLKKFVLWAKELGIQNTIVYAFSTENWNRTKEEVGSLMKIFEWFIEKEINKLVEEKIRVTFIGDRSRFSEKLQKGMRKAEKKTKSFKTHLIVALSYGGRDEIISAIKKIPGSRAEHITENRFSKYLFTKDIPDPDLIIRTGGEKRLSNFLLWQSAYSELFFVDTLWPDFSKKEFKGILNEYGKRERRRGK